MPWPLKACWRRASSGSPARPGEEDRAALLSAIANPARPGLWRHLVEPGALAWRGGALGVVSSVVQTRPPVPGEPGGLFRNLHVFVHVDGAWRCVLWQVTRLE
mgnify:CR=1 FL=1